VDASDRVDEEWQVETPIALPADLIDEIKAATK
jgi:hypothetical protein